MVEGVGASVETFIYLKKKGKRTTHKTKVRAGFERRRHQGRMGGGGGIFFIENSFASLYPFHKICIP